jgi:uncharacterized phage protein (TIGR01671 family)
MREIKFRGQLSHNKNWVFGNLIKTHRGKPYIYPFDVISEDGHHLLIDSDDAFWVVPETIGQYTGLKDKNGKEIYEGDILAIKKTKEIVLVEEEVGKFTAICEVVFDKEDACFKTEPSWNIWNKGKMEIIGNIIENKDLL